MSSKSVGGGGFHAFGATTNFQYDTQRRVTYQGHDVRGIWDVPLRYAAVKNKIQFHCRDQLYGTFERLRKRIMQYKACLAKDYLSTVKVSDMNSVSHSHIRNMDAHCRELLRVLKGRKAGKHLKSERQEKYSKISMAVKFTSANG